MDKVKCFLYDPGVMDAVLQAALAGGLKKAADLKAKQGAVVAAIVVNGELYLQSQAISGDVATEYDPDITWEEDPIIGINYVGYAIGKAMQTLRTSIPSKEGGAIGYGESNDVGSDREICFCHNHKGEKVQFLLILSYSGVSSQEDYQIARAASFSAWYKMSGYKNSNGSDIRLTRIAGSCC